MGIPIYVHKLTAQIMKQKTHKTSVGEKTRKSLQHRVPWVIAGPINTGSTLVTYCANNWALNSAEIFQLNHPLMVNSNFHRKISPEIVVQSITVGTAWGWSHGCPLYPMLKTFSSRSLLWWMKGQNGVGYFWRGLFQFLVKALTSTLCQLVRLSFVLLLFKGNFCSSCKNRSRQMSFFVNVP